MALIKCSECGKEISDKAVACPFCGNPIQTTATPEEKPVTIELTSKKWKKRGLWALLIIFIGICTLSYSAGLGILVILIGVIVGITARVGAWWTNG